VAQGRFDSCPPESFCHANVGRLGGEEQARVISTWRDTGEKPVSDGADGETIGNRPGDVTAGRDRHSTLPTRHGVPPLASRPRWG